MNASTSRSVIVTSILTALGCAVAATTVVPAGIQPISQRATQPTVNARPADAAIIDAFTIERCGKELPHHAIGLRWTSSSGKFSAANGTRCWFLGPVMSSTKARSDMGSRIALGSQTLPSFSDENIQVRLCSF